MPEALITSRSIQNLHTGIDLAVPEYQEIHGKLMSGHVEYQIVVVTQLASFKSAKHKAKDVVQLVVPKKYSEIDDLYQKLSNQYPNAKLPPMPRKVLFVGEADIRERRVIFDEIFRFIAKDATLASSPELLDFLGAKTKDLGDLKFKTRNSTDEELQEDGDDSGDFFNQETSEDVGVPRSFKSLLPTEEKIEEISDPLGVTSYILKNTEASNQEAKPKLSLFDEEVDADASLFELVKNFTTPAMKKSFLNDAAFRLFEDPDLGGTVQANDPLLLPAAFDLQAGAANVNFDESTEELFRVEDDLDKLLKLSSSNKTKPGVPPKPSVPKKTESSPEIRNNPAAEHSSFKSKAADMDELDILKYIQENEKLSSDTLDLF
ncbi:HCLS1-binding protein 3 [Stegostoma tigrinum]|uniref:HCLS1-binding protein 3 n=1 Tax=Stegostoma tigrinum TaxID=3053191 RepID=UPI00202B29AE|nr:HCLS1-binding protein 3 [Stegostoma tigrinum]